MDLFFVLLFRFGSFGISSRGGCQNIVTRRRSFQCGCEKPPIASVVETFLWTTTYRQDLNRSLEGIFGTNGTGNFRCRHFVGVRYVNNGETDNGKQQKRKVSGTWGHKQ
eukprot:scaffold2021_cov176-Amphora_coffeaeformis.AAC.2